MLQIELLGEVWKSQGVFFSFVRVGVFSWVLCWFKEAYRYCVLIIVLEQILAPFLADRMTISTRFSSDVRYVRKMDIDLSSSSGETTIFWTTTLHVPNLK